VVLIVVAVLGVLLVAALVSVVRARRAVPWALEEGSDGDHVTLWAVAPGRKRMTLGVVELAAPDAEKRVADLRTAGEERIAALNARRRVAG